ncbi:MAG: patatin-like phospholipase family protein [Gammaproteobacteria bacterium]|nr:patatin-like phospholipase family protein [Gammaproteobacteria bacterium]
MTARPVAVRAVVPGMLRWLLIALALFALTACGALPRQPVPTPIANAAEPLPGVAAVRAWSGSFSEQFEDDLLLAARQAHLAGTLAGRDPWESSDILAISGGADYGAFGAGLLCGWTAAGTRPQFKVVTGISAGALLAPFVFLGPEQDEAMKAAFTRTSARDIFHTRWLSALWSDGLVDTTPLARLIARNFDEAFLAQVAEAHREGRRLYVGTTNLDADRLVIWNMGAIAASGHPQAPALFHKIVLASSSIPAVFPPVLIEVEVNGRVYDEMHVDGGVKAQVFLTAASIDLTRIRRELARNQVTLPQTRLYVLRNAKIVPEPEPTPRHLVNIVDRATSSFIKSQARGDLYQIYAVAEEQDFEFRWVAIPDDFNPRPEAPYFDTAEMNRLFRIGYEMGLSPDPWYRQPPGFDRH